jgi:hypothetical protein
MDKYPQEKLMKLPFVLGVSGFAGLLFQAGAFAASDNTEATVAVHSIDVRGRPPFKRKVEHLPLSEVARLEAATAEGARETTVRTVDFTGRPPFRRDLERVEIVDAARLELSEGLSVEGDDRSRFSGRASFKRHR